MDLKELFVERIRCAWDAAGDSEWKVVLPPETGETGASPPCLAMKHNRFSGNPVSSYECDRSEMYLWKFGASLRTDLRATSD